MSSVTAAGTRCRGNDCVESLRISSVFHYAAVQRDGLCHSSSNVETKRTRYLVEMPVKTCTKSVILERMVEIFFARARFQRAHGIGHILGGFFRCLVLPFFKTNGKKLTADAIKRHVEVADDVVEGTLLNESAKQRISAGIKRTVKGLGCVSISCQWKTKGQVQKACVTFSRNGFRLRTVVPCRARERAPSELDLFSVPPTQFVASLCESHTTLCS